MKCYPSQFARLPYYEDLKIAHLFDTMHVGKNVTETLWRTIDGAHDRDKIDKICADIEKSNHAMKSVIDRSNNNGGRNYNNIPWLLTEQQSNDVKEVVRRIKFPTGFASNINNILTKKGDFSGVKTHDWHTFVKVIFLVYVFVCYCLNTYFKFSFFLFNLETNNDSFFIVIVCSTCISPKRLRQQCQTSYIWS